MIFWGSTSASNVSLEVCSAHLALTRVFLRKLFVCLMSFIRFQTEYFGPRVSGWSKPVHRLSFLEWLGLHRASR